MTWNSSLAPRHRTEFPRPTSHPSHQHRQLVMIIIPLVLLLRRRNILQSRRTTSLTSAPSPFLTVMIEPRKTIGMYGNGRILSEYIQILAAQSRAIVTGKGLAIIMPSLRPLIIPQHHGPRTKSKKWMTTRWMRGRLLIGAVGPEDAHRVLAIMNPRLASRWRRSRMREIRSYLS